MPAHARGAGAGTGGEGVCMGDTGLVEAGRDALPFELTPGQDHALGAILAGLQGPPPMMCLLQARAHPLTPPSVRV